MIGAIGNSYMSHQEMVQEARMGNTSDIPPTELKAMKKSGEVECSTCASRKYQDGSDENVSFKSASHVSVSQSGAAVRAHEQEHVKNAYNDAAQNNGQVMNATVSIEMAVCPECGRSYTAGGLTRTAIKYTEDNPYSQAAKVQDSTIYAGFNVDENV